MRAIILLMRAIILLMRAKRFGSSCVNEKKTILFLHSQNLKNVKLYHILRCPVIKEVLWDTLCGSMTDLLIR